MTRYAVAWALAAAVVSVWTLHRRSRFTVLSVVGWAAIVASLTYLAVLFGIAAVGLNRFGMINVLLRQVVIGIPLAATAFAVLGLRRGWRAAVSPFGTAVLLVALALFPFGVYLVRIEPDRLVVHHERLQAGLGSGPAAKGRELRIGILADLQLSEVGPHERAAVDALMAEHPDVILLPGDMFQGSQAKLARQLPALRGLLARLDAPGGVYLTPGNIDTDESLPQITAGTRIELLVNELVHKRVAGIRVAVAGVPYDFTGSHGVVARLARTPADVRILLAHTPAATRMLSTLSPQADVVVSGHTHGGQIRLPWLGPLIINGGVPKEVAAGGLHALDGRWVYVSTGVGVERGQAPKMRLGVPPSVTVLTLTGRP